MRRLLAETTLSRESQPVPARALFGCFPLAHLRMFLRAGRCPPSGGSVDRYGQAGYGMDAEAMPLDTNRNMEPVGPMGSLITCATDVVKWLRMHLNGGVADDGTRIVDAALLSATRTPESSLRSNPLRLIEAGSGWPEAQAGWDYALGWTTGSYRGYRRDNHVRASHCAVSWRSPGVLTEWRSHGWLHAGGAGYGSPHSTCDLPRSGPRVLDQ